MKETNEMNKSSIVAGVSLIIVVAIAVALGIKNTTTISRKVQIEKGTKIHVYDSPDGNCKS